MNPGRSDCSEEHLLNGSATPKADAIADVKNVAKTFVDPVVVPASPAEDGSGSSGEIFGGGAAAVAAAEAAAVSLTSLHLKGRCRRPLKRSDAIISPVPRNLAPSELPRRGNPP